jgi:hypothetical protein
VFGLKHWHVSMSRPNSALKVFLAPLTDSARGSYDPVHECWSGKRSTLDASARARLSGRQAPADRRNLPETDQGRSDLRWEH